ncbi:MAG: protein BatD [Saprospiraceae bacterium]|nr:protein BatD [Saprospiraceae bacterium]
MQARCRFLLLLLTVGLSSAPGSRAWAQTLVAKSSSPEISMGSRFEVSFSIQNVRASRFTAPEFKGFRYIAGPFEQRGMTIVNGKTSSHQSWVFELEALKPGNYTLDPARVTVGGKAVESNRLAIKVVPPRTAVSKNPGSKEDLFVSGELSSEMAWIGQQVTFSVKLYTSVAVEGADLIELPSLDSFYAREKQRFDTRVQYQTLNGKKYAVKTLYEAALFSQKAGEYTIDIARVRAGLPRAGAMGSLFGATPVLLQTQPVTLTVRELPQPVPAAFCGAVGRYEWNLETGNTNIRADEAFTLKITTSGDGDPRRFAPPKLVLPEGLDTDDAPRIAESDEYESGESWKHTQVMEYLVLPSKPGVYTFTPEWQYFDTDSNAYRIWKPSQPIVVQVSPGAPIKALPEPAAPLEKSPLDNIKPWVLLPVTIFLSVFILWWWQRRKRQNRSLENTLRPATPHSNIQNIAKLRQLATTAPAREFYHAFLLHWEHYLAYKTGIAHADLTKQNLRQKLEKLSVPQNTTDEAIQLWNQAELALFAGQTPQLSPLACVEKAEALEKVIGPIG